MTRQEDHYGRCVVCGRTSTEDCNMQTHAVHDRAWETYRAKKRARAATNFLERDDRGRLTSRRIRQQ